MSSFIHVQSFRNGTISMFKRSIVWNVFASKSHKTREGWGLMYGDQNGGVLYLDDDENIHGFSILRVGPVAFDDLYNLARIIPSLIYWPDACAVADPAFLAGMPDMLLQAFDQPPAVVHSGDELLDCYRYN